METPNNIGVNQAYVRFAHVGPVITGVLGIILAINASLGDDFVGAGLLLAASALSFATLAYLLDHLRN